MSFLGQLSSGNPGSVSRCGNPLGGHRPTTHIIWAGLWAPQDWRQCQCPTQSYFGCIYLVFLWPMRESSPRRVWALIWSMSNAPAPITKVTVLREEVLHCFLPISLSLHHIEGSFPPPNLHVHLKSQDLQFQTNIVPLFKWTLFLFSNEHCSSFQMNTVLLFKWTLFRFSNEHCSPLQMSAVSLFKCNRLQKVT